MIGSQAQIKQRLGPDLAALIVLGKVSIAFVSIAFVSIAFSMLLQQLRHDPVQYNAPGRADIPVHHFPYLVVVEIIEPTVLILTQKPALDQRLHGVQNTLLRCPGQREQGLEVEVTTEHCRQVEQRPVFMRHAGQTRTHRVT